MNLEKVEKGVQLLGVIFVASLFILATLQVILRYGFEYSKLLYLEEMGRYLLIWAALAGMTIENRRNGHIRITFVAERLPEFVQKSVSLTLDLAVLLLFLVLAYTGIQSTIFNHAQESNGIQVPLSIPFVAVPVSFMISALFIVENLRKYRKPSR